MYFTKMLRVAQNLPTWQKRLRKFYKNVPLDYCYFSDFNCTQVNSRHAINTLAIAIVERKPLGFLYIFFIGYHVSFFATWDLFW